MFGEGHLGPLWKPGSFMQCSAEHGAQSTRQDSLQRAEETPAALLTPAPQVLAPNFAA